MSLHVTYQYYFQQRNWHNKWWVNIWCSFKITHAVKLLWQKIKLCSFANLISQTFSDSAVIIGYSSALKTYQLWIRKAGVLDFCLPTIRPFQNNIFKDYFFTAVVGFEEPFSVNFLSSEKLWNKTPCPLWLVSFVDWKISKLVWDLITLCFFRKLISNVHKSVVFINSTETRFSWNAFWSRLIDSQHVFYRV